MDSKIFPKPRPALEFEYRRECNRNNLRYVWYFSVLSVVVFGIHLAHHFRLGEHALSAEMMPFTLLYSFGILYPGVNLLLLYRVKDIPSLTPLAVFIELIFPFFMAAIAVLLSVLGVIHSAGITPFAIILMLVCFLLQGQFLLCVTIVVLSWLSMSLILIGVVSLEVASPALAMGLTSGFSCIVVANITENMRIRQFEVVVQLNNSNRQLQLLSSQDHLTGLLNRRSFDARLEREMARSERFGHPLSLLLIDIDEFKSINDTFGHLYGDQVIQSVANVLKKHIRDVDEVGRMGGDEFVVVLIETDKTYAIQVADRMRREVNSLPLTEEQKQITISVGHAEYEGESLSAFIERADKALYQAKRAGKNRVRSMMMGQV